MSGVQVLNFNGIEVLSSLDLAEAIGKEHNHLMRDIRNYSKHLEHNPELDAANLFIESSYVDSNKRTRPSFLLTKKGCEFIGNKMTGKKGTLFTASYIDAFHKMEDYIKQQQQSKNEVFSNPFDAIMQVVQQSSIMYEQLQQQQMQINSVEKAQEEQHALLHKQSEELKEVQDVKKITSHDFLDWRDDSNKIVRKIAQTHYNSDYSLVWKTIYTRLKQRGFDIERRAENASKRTGHNVSKLDIISNDKKLREAFIAYIREIAIQHNISL